MHDKQNRTVVQTMNSFCKIIKIEFYRKVVRRIVLGNCPTIHVGEAHILFRRVTQQIHLGGLSNIFISEGCTQLKQIFLLKTIFIHGINMYEGVSEDSRHRIGHVDIQVGVDPTRSTGRRDSL